MKGVVNNKFSLIFKIPMFILTIGYLTFFIYQYIKNGFEFNNIGNIIKIILVFLSVIFLGCATITTNKRAIIFTSLNYITLLILIIPIIVKVIPKTDDYKEEKTSKENITCDGKSDISDNTKVEISKKGNEIQRIVYTYTFDIKDQTEAENVFNRFDKQFNSINNIYSEITISDNVIVTFTYNLENVKLEDVKAIDDSITTSYKDFKDKQLSGFSCKTN